VALTTRNQRQMVYHGCTSLLLQVGGASTVQIQIATVQLQIATVQLQIATVQLAGYRASIVLQYSTTAPLQPTRGSRE
jgi:hypothetical protein